MELKPMDLGEIGARGFVSALESIPDDLRARLTDRGLYANAQSGTATTDDEVYQAIRKGDQYPRGVQVTHIRKRRIILLNPGARPTPQSFADDHCMDAACIALANVLSHCHNTTEVVCEVRDYTGDWRATGSRSDYSCGPLVKQCYRSKTFQAMHT